MLGDLKSGIGFPGFVVPDFGFALRDPLAATLAGTDLPALSGAGGLTADLFTSGQVPAARLDDIVHRILFALFDSGAFDNPLPAPSDNVSTAPHQQAATPDLVLGWLRARSKIVCGIDGVWTRLTPPARHQIPPVFSRRAGGASHAQPLVNSHN